MRQLRDFNQNLSAMNQLQSNHSTTLEDLKTLSSVLEDTSLVNSKALGEVQERLWDTWVIASHGDNRTQSLSGNTLLVNCTSITKRSLNRFLTSTRFLTSATFSVS